jgi:hypothetical protein
MDKREGGYGALSFGEQKRQNARNVAAS